MKPTPIFVAAAGFAMLGACSVATNNDENAAETVDSNSTTTASGSTAAPAGATTGESDTLGNQLNQLEESGTAANEEADSASNNSAD